MDVIAAPLHLYVVEVIGASGESTHLTFEESQRALDEADVLAKTGARVRVITYDPTNTIFVSQGWTKDAPHRT